MRIGSLCTGYGGLDGAVQAVLGGDLAWVADPDPGAATLLAHHHPDVPNLGDITGVGWANVPAVDILTAGFPCQDISNAGKRAGIEGERSGIWTNVVAAVGVLRPRYALFENVGALAVRGLDTVLADLAEIGFDAEWTSLRASDVGACHRRERIFILAWPASDAAHLGHDGPGSARAGRDGSADRGAPAAHTDGAGRARLQRDPQGADGYPERGDDAERRGPGTWGPYADAIARWERVTGRVAPVPTEPGRTGQPRLSPAFVEWLMGLPEGHITAVPGLSRNQQLRLGGNGVVPQQGALALRLLLERATATEAA